jgi:hypothetical protein
VGVGTLVADVAVVEGIGLQAASPNKIELRSIVERLRARDVRQEAIYRDRVMLCPDLSATKAFRRGVSIDTLLKKHFSMRSELEAGPSNPQYPNVLKMPTFFAIVTLKAKSVVSAVIPFPMRPI